MRKKRFSRLKKRFRRYKAGYVRYIRARRQRKTRKRSRSTSKILSMTWFKKNWMLLLMGAVAAYFFSAKFKDWADSNVLSKIKKP